MSDNGGVVPVPTNNLPLRGDKLTVFEGGVRVAAAVRWPAAWEGGRKVNATMGYIDVLPTVLASAGAEAWAGKPLDGVDVRSALEGTAETLPDRDWYSYHGQPGPDEEFLAVKTPEWKLVILGPDIREGIKAQHDVFLFEMPDDWQETNNLAADHPDVVDMLTEKLLVYRLLQPTNAVPPFHKGRENFVAPTDYRLDPSNE